MKNFVIFILISVVSFAYCDDFEDEFEQEFATKEVFDPLQGYNRAMTSFNDYTIRYVFVPIFKGYDFIVPDQAQSCIHNFFYNIMYPLRFANNILQFKFKNAGEETLGFVANIFIGFGGLFDAAGNVYKIPKHNEDFGQTLGHWGVGSGFPVVLPFLGQSNLRDITGMVGNYYMNPLTYKGKDMVGEKPLYALTAWNTVNEGSLYPNAYEQMTGDTLDLYLFLRDAYEQRRNALIKE